MAGLNKTDSLITVAVLLHGSHRSLTRTLRSIFSQTYPLIDVLVSDDATEGLTEESLKYELAEFFAYPNFHVRVNPVNMGTTAHLNYVASIVTGEYIKFMTADDTFTDKYVLSAYYEYAKKTDSEIVFSKMKIHNSDGSSYIFPSSAQVRLLNSKPYEKVYAALARKNIIPSPAAFYRRAFFMGRGGFDESYRYLEDWPTWLKLSRQGDRLPCMNNVCIEYQRGGISSDNGGVYASPRLRADMILCYQKEIFPFKNKLTGIDLYCINYFYSLLIPDTLAYLYFPLALARKIKKLIKF